MELLLLQQVAGAGGVPMLVLHRQGGPARMVGVATDQMLRQVLQLVVSQMLEVLLAVTAQEQTRKVREGGQDSLRSDLTVSELQEERELQDCNYQLLQVPQ